MAQPSTDPIQHGSGSDLTNHRNATNRLQLGPPEISPVPAHAPDTADETTTPSAALYLQLLKAYPQPTGYPTPLNSAQYALSRSPHQQYLRRFTPPPTVGPA